MLGTVNADGPQGPRYFDYDWNAARAYAGVESHTDLRLHRIKRSLGGYPYPSAGKLVLFGIPS
jgi:hypothetical protein